MSIRALESHRDGDVYGNVRAKHFPLGAIGGDAVHGCQRIGGDHCAPPAYHIARHRHNVTARMSWKRRSGTPYECARTCSP